MKLFEENYFSPEANKMYMGSSQFKSFQKCEVQALAILSGEYQSELSTALLVGSYVDNHFSGTLDTFKAKNPQIFLKSGDLKADYRHANYIISRVERDEKFYEAISGGSQEILTGEIEGVPVKIKIDSMLPDRTVDLKVMRSFEDIYIADEGYVPFWKAWRYDLQAAMYQEIRRQNDGELKPFGLAVITKEKPESDIGLFEFTQHTLDTALDEIKSEIVYFDGLKKGLFEPVGCGNCPVCRRNKKLKGWVII